MNTFELQDFNKRIGLNTDLKNISEQICNKYNLKNNEEFLKEFDKNYQKKLKYIFENKLYIPQEVFNASIAEKIMKGE